MKYQIYKITNIVNNMIYIGCHSNSHQLNDYYFTSSKVVWREINYYGKENFKREIIELTDDKTRESFWILKLESYKNNIGYNIRKGYGHKIEKNMTRKKRGKNKEKHVKHVLINYQVKGM